MQALVCAQVILYTSMNWAYHRSIRKGVGATKQVAPASPCTVQLGCCSGTLQLLNRSPSGDCLRWHRLFPAPPRPTRRETCPGPHRPCRWRGMWSCGPSAGTGSGSASASSAPASRRVLRRAVSETAGTGEAWRTQPAPIP